MKSIYLDYAASTPTKPRVRNIISRTLDYYGNPSSMHNEGIKAKQIIDNTSEIIANKLNCNISEIFYTTGATMSNSLLIEGFIKRNEAVWKDFSIVYSNVEHNDIIDIINNNKHIKSTSYLSVPVDSNGIIDLQYLDNIISKRVSRLRDDVVLVTIQMANSETGVIQPINEISKIVHKYPNTFLHMDATQYIPYYPINVKEMEIDALSMSGQKIGCIKGTGMLYISEKLQEYIAPVIHGEQGLIGGTPATPLIVALGEAFQLIDYDIRGLKHKRDFLLDELEKLGGILIGAKDNRLPNNIYIRFPGVNGLMLQNLLNEYEIYIGTGSACSSDSDKPSHVALAYGLNKEESFECVRFSLGNNITYEDLEYVIRVLKGLLITLKGCD